MSQQPELAGRVIGVAFAEPRRLREFRGVLEADVPLYTDPGRAVYDALGFTRGSVRRVWLDPRVWWRYAKLLSSGMRLKRTEEDTLQMAGDAVVDGSARLTWIHRSTGPDDRPSVAEVVAAFRDATAATRPCRPRGEPVESRHDSGKGWLRRARRVHRSVDVDDDGGRGAGWL